jgi:hypothetical protein
LQNRNNDQQASAKFQKQVPPEQTDPRRRSTGQRGIEGNNELGQMHAVGAEEKILREQRQRASRGGQNRQSFLAVRRISEKHPDRKKCNPANS